MNNDEIMKAIIKAFDHNQPPKEQKLAERYCEQMKHSEHGYQFCLQALHQQGVWQGRDEIKFWFLECILYTVDNRYKGLPEEQKNFIRQSLMSFIRDVLPKCVQPPFIKMKLSVVLVKIIKHDYPERWPSFFSELLSQLKNNDIEIVDMFLRILNTIIDEIVIWQEQRTTEEVIHNTLIKDKMRETYITQIIDAMYKILMSCQPKHIKLAQSCMETLREYIGWIDTDLLANQRFISLFYRFLSITELQQVATSCIREVIHKRMDSHKKVALLKNLNLINVLSEIKVDGVVRRCSDCIGQRCYCFAAELAALVNTLGVQIIDCAKTGCAHDALVMLNGTLHLGYRFLGHCDFEVAEEIQEFYYTYIVMLKGITLSQQQDAHFRQIFKILSKSIDYPEWFNFDKNG